MVGWRGRRQSTNIEDRRGRLGEFHYGRISKGNTFTDQWYAKTTNSVNRNTDRVRRVRHRASGTSFQPEPFPRAKPAVNSGTLMFKGRKKTAHPIRARTRTRF